MEGRAGCWVREHLARCGRGLLESAKLIAVKEVELDITGQRAQSVRTTTHMCEGGYSTN